MTSWTCDARSCRGEEHLARIQISLPGPNRRGLLEGRHRLVQCPKIVLLRDEYVSMPLEEKRHFYSCGQNYLGGDGGLIIFCLAVDVKFDVKLLAVYFPLEEWRT
ncbi:hypothetical protein MTO96_018439 [Rhipicephalus appendiculatus]